MAHVCLSFCWGTSEKKDPPKHHGLFFCFPLVFIRKKPDPPKKKESNPRPLFFSSRAVAAGGVHLRLLRGCGGLREALWARGAGGWPGTVRGEAPGAPGPEPDRIDPRAGGGGFWKSAGELKGPPSQ